MLTIEVKQYIEKSVLCWLATCDNELVPNVSPKEMFTFADDSTLLIANIASPQSMANIRQNPNVCVSFVDVFVQKGFKIKGLARIIEPGEPGYKLSFERLTTLYTDQFPIRSIIEIEITKVDPIKAPSYFLSPGTTEASQVASAMETYGVRPRT